MAVPKPFPISCFAAMLAALLFCRGCTSTTPNETPTGSTASDTSRPGHGTATTTATPLTFIDSINHKLDLSVQQMLTHTLIDSVYIKENCTFTGDTVYTNNGKYAFVLVDYSDALVCSYKFLLVFDLHSMHNTCQEIVKTDCDRDLSTWNRVTTFKIDSDSSFITTETFYPPETDTVSKPDIESQRWTINQSGTIVPATKG